MNTKNKITITITDFGITHKAELDQNISSEQFIETCCKLAESLTFSPDQVRKGLRKSLEIRE